MEFLQKMKDGYRQFADRVSTFMEPVRNVFGGISNFFKVIWGYIVRMRKIIMAIPVVLATVKLAAYNSAHLPETVGITLLANGEYGQVISRELAVLGPTVVTGFCLVLMFCSRRTLYPWLISIFSLVLPVLLLLVNVYPM